MRFRVSVAKLALRHPIEAFDRLSGQLEDRHVEYQRRAASGAYTVDSNWLDTFNSSSGTKKVSGDERDFWDSWRAIERAAVELNVHSHDGDAAFARAVWHAIRCGGAERIVESGVARGVSSRIALEALKVSSSGHLWSVDLPLLSQDWARLLATAVPEGCRPRWTYIRGSTRRVLPGLLRKIGPIDLFIQDSRSSLKTASMEFKLAWGALRPGGWLIANSVDRSVAFAEFVESVGPSLAVVAPFDRQLGLFGIARKS